MSTKAGSAKVDLVFIQMKTEFVDVNETRKNLRVEIPTDIVNAEIDRIDHRLVAKPLGHAGDIDREFIRSSGSHRGGRRG